jgi:hypothetical protein
MKPLRVIVIAALVTIAGCASAPQGIYVGPDDAVAPAEDRIITHIGEAKGVAKADLFATARLWLAESFRSSKAVIDLEDKAEGVIVGNASMPYPRTGCSGLYCSVIADWQVQFKIRIDVKDERFRVTFTDLELFVPASFGNFATPAMRRPMTLQQELSLCRPELIALASSITGYTSKAQASKNW